MHGRWGVLGGGENEYGMESTWGGGMRYKWNTSREGILNGKSCTLEEGSNKYTVPKHNLNLRIREKLNLNL